MKVLAILIALSFSDLYAEDFEQWVQSIEKRIDLGASNFLGEIKAPQDFDQIQSNANIVLPSNKKPQIPANCNKCSRAKQPVVENPNILIFISFSVPDAIWLSLSKELEGKNGVFVLRGLPANSFQELASQIMVLKQQGMKAEVQIYPKLFEEFNITQVPAIVIKQECQKYNGQNGYDKIGGTVSLGYALRTF